MQKIICVAGPTASGKTRLAVELAKAYNGEVISCDSMQVYRYMDIGTAKPTQEEMQGIPHHMLSVADPNEDFSVSRYCDMAATILDDILARGKTAIIAGGTGLYMDSLIRGNTFAPYPATGRREELEAIAEKDGIQAVRDMLYKVDPDAASRLHLSDKKRIIRAMEVYLETGETITAHNLKTQQQPPRYQPVWLGLNDARREDLYARINRRVELMIEDGLIKEIRNLLESGISEKATAMQAIGYKEFIDALAGRCTIDEAIALVQQSSRKYAKRQLTWFRRNDSMRWLIRNPEEGLKEILLKARQNLTDFDKQLSL